MSAAPWAMRALWAWAGLLGMLLVVFGFVAESDGTVVRAYGGRCSRVQRLEPVG